jgi:hypothetical protein
MRLERGIFRFGQTWLIFRRYPSLAADHGADHQRFGVDGSPAGQVLISFPIKGIAAACSSLTLSPSEASAAISWRAR